MSFFLGNFATPNCNDKIENEPKVSYVIEHINNVELDALRSKLVEQNREYAVYLHYDFGNGCELLYYVNDALWSDHPIIEFYITFHTDNVLGWRSNEKDHTYNINSCIVHDDNPLYGYRSKIEKIREVFISVYKELKIGKPRPWERKNYKKYKNNS